MPLVTLLRAIAPVALVIAACSAVLLQHHRRSPVRARQVALFVGALLVALLLASCGRPLVDTSVMTPQRLTIIVQNETSIQYRTAGDQIHVAKTRGWRRLDRLPFDYCVSLGAPAPGETTPAAWLWPEAVCQELR